MATQIDYSKLIVTKGAPYADSKLKPYSHYKDPLTTAAGLTGGNSRIWGDASPEVQKKVIDTLITVSGQFGLNTRETALVLAIARTESGFNPDAASNESASGLGQFIDGTGASYGLGASNRWNLYDQSVALVRHFYDNQVVANSRGKGEEYIYKYHHDGPNGEYGGLVISREKVLPLADKYEALLIQSGGGTSGGSTPPPIPPASVQKLGDVSAFSGLVKGVGDIVVAGKGIINEAIQDIKGSFAWAQNEIDKLVNNFTQDSASVQPSNVITRPTTNITTVKGNNGYVDINHNSGSLQVTESGIVYKVKSGDTLGVIAAANNISLPQLLAANPQIPDANAIQIGQVVTMPVLVKTASPTGEIIEVVQDSSNTYDIFTGALLGKSLTLLDLDLYTGTSTTDSLSGFLDSIRNTGVVEQSNSVVTVGEIRTLTGSQADGELWGGGSYLGFTGDLLTDWYNDTAAQNGLFSGLGSLSQDTSGSSFTLLGTPIYLSGFDLAGVDYSPFNPDYSFAGLDTGLGLISDWNYADTLFTGSYSGVDYLLGGSSNYSLGSTSTFFDNDYSVTSPGWDFGYNSLDYSYGLGLTDYSGLGSLADWGGSTFSYGLGNTTYDYGFGSTGYDTFTNPSYVDTFYTPSYSYDSYSYGSYSFGGYSSFSSFSYSYYPVALDLDGDGVELVSQTDSRAYFDTKGDGFRRHTGWVGADDGFLTIDSNGDGKIDQADELSFALLTANQGDTDLEALKTVFDTNLNNKIDVGDAQFGQFRVWQDKNGDGVTDTGELKTLAEAGITSVNLTAAKTDWASGGNRIQGFTTFQKTDGTNGWAADVGLGYEEDGWKSSVESGLVRMTQSGGLVYGLSQGGALNLDLGVNGLDGAFGGSSADTLSTGARASALLNGGDGNDILTGGTGDDWLSGGNGADTLNGGDGDDTLLIDASDMAANIKGGVGFDIAVMTGTVGGTLDLAPSALEAVVGSEAADTFSTSGTGRVILAGRGGNDTLSGNVGKDLLQGGTGNDSLYGAGGDDVYIFNRGDGSDTITDSATRLESYLSGVELTYPWVGDAYMQMYLDRAVYYATGIPLGTPLYADVISSFAQGTSWQYTTASRAVEVDAGQDTLRFGAGITLDDLELEYSGADIVVGLREAGVETSVLANRVVLKNWTTTASRVESIELADGSRYTIADMLIGTAGADALTGNATSSRLYGGGGNDTLNGAAGADWLNGGTGADTLSGLAGNDIYIVDNADDVVSEGALNGDDLVQSSVTYTLSTNIENLTLGGTAIINGTGNALANVMSGNGAANILDGGLGADTLIGGLGNDTYVVDNLNDVVTETSTLATEIDSVQSAVTFTLGANLENLTLTGTALIDGTGNALANVLRGNSAANILSGLDGIDTLYAGDDDEAYGGAGNDTLIAENTSLWVYLSGEDGDDTLTGGAGSGSYSGGLGNDTITGGAGFNYIWGDDSYGGTTGGIDTIYGGADIDYAWGGFDNDTIYGNSGDDTLSGQQGDDKLYGGIGNDNLIGGVGNDLLVGGLGDDTYTVDIASDIVTENLNEGTDTVRTSATRTLDANVEHLTLIGTAAINGTGNILDNTLTGNSANNTLAGGAGNDTLIGSATNVASTVPLTSLVIYARGTPVLGGYPAMQVYVNGVLVQTFNVDAASYTAYTVDPTKLGTAADKVDIVFGNDAYRPDLGQDRNLFVQKIVANGQTTNAIDNGVFLDNGSGAAAVDGINLRTGQETLASNAALRFTLNDNDTLDGGTGADQLSGGLGNDTYLIDNLGDTVNELTNAGIDTVRSSLTHTLLTNVENLTLTGTTAINGTGNTVANLLIGNAANNILLGDAGDDTLLGSGGNDRLDGGIGNDILQGGQGNDTYVVGSAGDNLWEGINEGWDTVETGISYTLGANVENLTLTGTAAINGTGNALDNSLLGNSANNVLTGGAGVDYLDGGLGADTLIGGAGNDDYTVDNAGDIVTELVGEGEDGVNLYLAADYLLGSNLEYVYRYGPGNWKTTGNDLNNSLYGNGGNDTLLGLGGNDVLWGGAGIDTLQGGTGDDTYYIDNASDIVTENLNDGTDMVYVWSSMAYTLAPNVENGSRSFYAGSLTGNSLNNTLTGSYANDTLIGGVGNDRLIGGAGIDILQGGIGDDIYVVDVATDSVIENLNEGWADTVESAVTYTLGANVENLTLTGTAAIYGTGNTLNNILIGNGALNLLIGGAGADTMLGGGNDDIYEVDNIGDVVVENANEGNDTVNSSITYSLGANVEYLGLTGTAAINGTGNVLNNTIVGNSAINVLAGGLGNDVYVIGAGDTVVENANEGWDAVNSDVSYSLGANVESLYLMGTASINGSGNALNNNIVGNSAANVLVGGAGDDTYYTGQGDMVIENANEGWDFVYSDITYSLGANVENLYLMGTAAINGTGNALNNLISGNSAANFFAGGGGNDTYFISAGDTVVENVNEGLDAIYSDYSFTLGANLENLTLWGSAASGTGNALSNMLTGNTAANVLDGKSGADTLTGSTGNDTYLLGRSYGLDTIIETDATADNTDVAQFLSGVATDQIWFQHTGNNLEVSIIGTADKMVVKDWYLGTANHIEQFKTTDGAKTLLDSQVESLVNAMASFSPPAAGQTTLPPAYQTSLNPVLAANWQ